MRVPPPPPASLMRGHSWRLKCSKRASASGGAATRGTMVTAWQAVRSAWQRNQTCLLVSMHTYETLPPATPPARQHTCDGRAAVHSRRRRQALKHLAGLRDDLAQHAAVGGPHPNLAGVVAARAAQQRIHLG